MKSIFPSINSLVQARVHKSNENSTLRYECDETVSDECEFVKNTCQENVFRTSIVRNFISRGVK